MPNQSTNGKHDVIIKIDDLASGEVIALLEEHLRDMYATSPPESVHALDVDALKAPDITFFSAWIQGTLAGCVAIKQLNSTEAELKSMRTSQQHRKQGVAEQLLNHVFEHARQNGFTRISLETGTQDYFNPAHRLYKKHGFADTGPFSHYQESPDSRFMTKNIGAS